MTTPNPTLDTLVAAVETLDKDFDIVGPLTPAAEFVPLADALTKLLEKVQQMVESKGAAPAAEVAAADTAAAASEDLKFGVGKP